MQNYLWNRCQYTAFIRFTIFKWSYSSGKRMLNERQSYVVWKLYLFINLEMISNIKLHIIVHTTSLIIPMIICHQTATYLSVWPPTCKNLKFHLPSVNKSTHFCNVYSVSIVCFNSRCYILSKVFLYDRCFFV
jgi:hypothetical protein